MSCCLLRYCTLPSATPANTSLAPRADAGVTDRAEARTNVATMTAAIRTRIWRLPCCAGCHSFYCEGRAPLRHEARIGRGRRSQLPASIDVPERPSPVTTARDLGGC